MKAPRRETEVAIRAVAIARGIADSRRGADDVTSKGGIDLVTATDVACEDAIRAELLSAFPGYVVVGEERGGTPVPGAPCWLVDPICGTRAFASDIPLYCSNVALLESGSLSVAAVAVGCSAELAFAERGGGAWMRTTAGDRRIRAAAHSDTVWFSGYEPQAAEIVRRATVARRWYVWMFSSTLSYVYLASGRIAGIVHLGTSVVHVAAGCLLAAEAGATVTDLEGAPWSVGASGVLAAATPALHGELRALYEQSR